MKLLDPFAGYRLASGNELFHVALFVGSFWVVQFGAEGFHSNQEIKHAFNLLRWGHFILCILSIIEHSLTRPSEIQPNKK